MHQSLLMPDVEPARVAVIVAVFVLAGVVKGVVGLGLPTISMALLALVMPQAEAAALLVVPSLVTNVVQARPFRALPAMLSRLAGMQVGVCVGTIGGALVLGAPDGAAATRLLGGALVLYACVSLFARPMHVAPEHERALGPLVGAVTGVVTAATGVFVIPAVPYLTALELDRDALVQAMGISFTVSTLALAAALALNGVYDAAAFGASTTMLVPALVGMELGARLRASLSAATFKRALMVSLALLGTYQVVASLLAR